MEQRTRTRTVYNPMVLGYSYHRTGTTQHGMSSPPSHPIPGEGMMSTGYVSQTVIDFVTENWQSKRDAGEIVNNPFSSNKLTLTITDPGWLSHKYYKKNGTTCGSHTPSQTHDLHTYHEGIWRPNTPTKPVMDTTSRASIAALVKDLAVTQAFAHVDVSEMMALATAAEAGKSVDSMAAISRKAYKIFRNVRRLNIRALREEISLKELSDRYMEARYALRPLIYDAYGIANSVQANRGRIRRTFTGYEVRKGSVQVSSITNVLLAPMIYGDWARTLEYEISARAGVLCDVEVTDLSVFGIDQLAETAWELVPFSFIADWFANTGDWIAAHTPNAGIRQLASWVTVRERVSTTCTLVNTRSTAASSGFVLNSLTLPACKFAWEELVLTRIVEPAISTWPRFDLNLDGWKLTDLGIILRNITK